VFRAQTIGIARATLFTLRAFALAGTMLFISGLGACSWIDTIDRTGTGDGVIDRVQTTDLEARRSGLSKPRPENDTGSGQSPREQIYSNGSEDNADPRIGAVPSGASNGIRIADKGYDLNFDNADVGSVAKILLGDLLKVGYTVDKRVQGSITLSSGRPVPRADIIPVLEGALKVIGAAVVREGQHFKIIPAADAIGAGPVQTARGGRLEPGYGITVLPLLYVSAQTLQPAIEGFAARPGAVRIDQARNLLLVQGTSAERASAIEVALSLDVDWMKNQSVGVFPLRSANSDALIGELQAIFSTGKEASSGGNVRFQPIARMNAILVVAQTPDQLNRARTWIMRLDKSGTGAQVRVYRIRYAQAKTVGSILRDIFAGDGQSSQSGTGSGANSDLAQLLPGSGSQRSTIGSLAAPVRPGASESAIPSITGPGNQGGSGGDRNDAASPQGGAIGGKSPLANVRISTDAANNALLIYSTHEQYKIIEQAVIKLDRAPVQVAIEATIAEVTLNQDLQYGVQFYLRNKQGNSVGFGQTDILKRLIPGFNLVLGPEADPRVVIDAFRQITTVKVLSSPSLNVLENQTATLQVGDQVPITTRSAQGVDNPNSPIVNNIELRDTGVILKVTPRVNSDSVVTLEVQQEVSGVTGQGNQPSLTPTISQRKVKSSVAVASGQTVVLGGLISSHEERGKSGLPLPIDFNILGSNTGKVVNTELIIFIRPQIIRNDVDAQLVSEELRSKMKMMGYEHNERRSHSRPVDGRDGWHSTVTEPKAR
jgi:general secretion pathway protein D